MTPVAATPAHAGAMALVHAAAFLPGERWEPDAIALQLSLPGGYGFVALLPSPGKGRGEGRATQRDRSNAEDRSPWAGGGPCGLPHPDPLPEGEASGGFILARVAADEAEVLTLAVAPSARTRGLGRRLLRAALDHAQARGAASMFLEVSPANAPALALYAGAGFVPVGRRPRYYPGGGDALVLRRALIPGAAGEGRFRPAEA